MDLTALTQTIGALGFPIFACVAVFWAMLKQQESHKQEMTKLSDAVNNNTLVIQKLILKLEETKS